MKPERLAARVEDAYEHEELATSLAVIERRLRRRRAIRRGAVAISAVAAIAIALWAFREPAPPSPLTLEDGRSVGALIASADPLARLSDGSTIELASETRIDEVEQTEHAIVLRLASGTARFDVRPHRDREWSVVAGPLTVRVLGTAFTVTRDGASASVAVHRGVVAVETGEEARRLYAGERFEIGAREPAMRDPWVADLRSGDPRPGAPLAGAAGAPPERAPPVAAADRMPAPAPERPFAPPAPSARPSAAPSQADATDAPSIEPPDATAPAAAPSSETVEASPAQTAPSPEAVEASAAETPPSPESVDALLARADRARREGRTSDAIDALSAIVDEHPSAPEAPSAAVTLAQLEERRGRLERAALAYRRALALDPPPSLAELCYERLVRVHLARHDRDEALEARAEHRRRFPHGARSRAIDALLDPP